MEHDIMASSSRGPATRNSHESVSSTSTDEDVRPPGPHSRPRRQSSIRFSHGTDTKSRSPLSNRRIPSSSDTDEITPIRLADGNADRRYNTNEHTETEATGRQERARSPNPNNAQAPTNGTATEPEEKAPLYKRIAEKYGAVSLENKGSVARDHLALERTFLAWMRTSLAFASIGIAITQLFRLNTAIASHAKRYYSPLSTQAEDTLPFSPLLGQSVPEELVQYLQWQSQQQDERPRLPYALGPTLLDQLLLLPAPGSNGPQTTELSALDLTMSAFDEDGAARLRHVGKPLGATFLAISIVILFVGFHRYFESQYWIIRGKFPASRGSVGLVAFIAMALIVACLVVVVVIAPSSFEKR